MMSDTGESGRQRLKDWLNRKRRMARPPASAASLSAGEQEERLVAQSVATWEDEGGAPAPTARPLPKPAPAAVRKF